jgi:TolB-like protein
MRAKGGAVALGKKILVGTVMKMGNKILISGRIVDVEKGVGERAANQSASSADELDEAASKFARMLASN